MVAAADGHGLAITLPVAAVVGAIMWWIGNSVGGALGATVVFAILAALSTWMFLRSRQQHVGAHNVTEDWERPHDGGTGGPGSGGPASGSTSAGATGSKGSSGSPASNGASGSPASNGSSAAPAPRPTDAKTR